MQVGGDIRCFTSTGAVSSTAHVHILGGKICFEREVGYGQDNKRRGLCIDITPMHIQDGSYITSCVSSVSKVQEQYKTTGGI